jgi:predicted NUDIX family phosphoesterase
MRPISFGRKRLRPDADKTGSTRDPEEAAMSGPNSTRILVVPAAELDRLGRFQGFCPEADRYLGRLLAPGVAEFRPRAEMEDDPAFKQIIPYVLFRCGGLAFRYTRGAGQGEARLHARQSIGVGGHVDEADADGRATLDAYEMALLRELDEEVHLGSPGTIRRVGLINDDSTPVGRVHLGVVHVYDLERPEVSPREEGLAEAGFSTLADLAAGADRLESWSRIALEAGVLGGDLHRPD